MPSNNKTSRAIPIAAVLAASALGASSGLYIKGLAFSGLALSSLRMTVPFLLTLPSAARHGLVLGKPGIRGRLFFASALNAFRLYLYILAYKLTTIGNAVVLLSLWPLFALLIESRRSKKPLSPLRLSVLILASAGVAVMNLDRGFSPTGADMLGSLLMIVSAFVFAVTAIVFKEALSVMSELDALYFQNAVGAIVFLPFLIAEIPSVPLAHLGVGLVYGFAAGFVGFGLFFVAMKRLPLFQYSALTYSEILFGLFFGIIFRGENFTLLQGCGVVLILTGSLWAQKLRLAEKEGGQGPGPNPSPDPCPGPRNKASN